MQFFIFLLLDGMMKDNLSDNGKIIKCMEEVFLHGKMAENMKDNILTISKKIFFSIYF